MHKILLLFLCSIQCCLAQTEKNITGVVVANDLLISDVDVINDRTRTSQTSNSAGQFSILAQVGDTLIFHSINFTAKRIRLKEADFANPNFKVFLYKKIEELEEVIITNDVQPILNSKDIIGYRDYKGFKDGVKNPHMYTAEIQYGPDLIKMVSLVAGLLKKPKEDSAPAKPIIGFKQFVDATYDKEYLKKTFKLEEDEIALFLEFCEADAKAYSVKESADKLGLLELLFRKNEEFKRLERVRI